MNRARALMVSAWHRFRHDWPELLLCTLVFQGVMFLLVAPFGNWVLAQLIASTGGLAVSNEQIAAFLLSGPGALAAFLMIAAASAVEFAQYAGLLWIASADIHGEEGTAYAALRRLAATVPQLLRLAARQALILLLCMLPFLAAAGGAFLYATSEYDINFLLHERPPMFWWMGGLVALIALGAAFVFLLLRVRWVYTIPLVMLEGTAPRAALKESRAMVAGNGRRVLLMFAVWWSLASVVALGGMQLLYLLGAGVLAVLGGGLSLVLAIVAVLVLLHLAFVALATFLVWAGDALFVLHLYRDARGAPMPSPGDKPAPQRRHRPLPWIVAIVTVVLGVGFARAMAELVDVQRDVKITAHRGSSAAAPENTLAAVRQAIEDGADYAEIDVQEIADGAIVVMHDTDFKRVSGVDRKIWEVDSKEVKTYDVGKWFAERFEGERVPTLEEMIALAGDRIRLNIELKIHGHEKAYVPSVVRILRETKFRDKCVISSLNHGALQEVRKLDPELKVGAIVFEAVGDLTRLDVDFLSVRTAVARPELIRRARARGMEVHVWTVNAEAEMTRFVDLRVANIITDEPVRLREVIAVRDELDDQDKILLALRNWWTR